MTDNILSMLGLAHKAGKVEIGEEPVGAAARAKKARVIFIAEDAAPSTKRRAKSFAETGSCILLPFPAEKAVMGQILGRTSCAMCAVTEIGFAHAIVKKLADTDPQIYQAAAEALGIKAKRAAERKREQVQHEKNRKTGKKREKAVAVAPKAEEKKESRPVSPNKRSARVGSKRTKPSPKERFAGSLPVKKGKGSKTSKTSAKALDHH